MIYRVLICVLLTSVLAACGGGDECVDTDRITTPPIPVQPSSAPIVDTPRDANGCY